MVNQLVLKSVPNHSTLKLNSYLTTRSRQHILVLYINRFSILAPTKQPQQTQLCPFPLIPSPEPLEPLVPRVRALVDEQLVARADDHLPVGEQVERLAQRRERQRRRSAEEHGQGAAVVGVQQHEEDPGGEQGDLGEAGFSHVDLAHSPLMEFQ